MKLAWWEWKPFESDEIVDSLNVESRRTEAVGWVLRFHPGANLTRSVGSALEKVEQSSLVCSGSGNPAC